mgnify:CR=1 FL=1
MAHSNDTVQMEQLWTNARLATMAGDDLGLIDCGAVAAAEGRIVYAGPVERAPATAQNVIDCEGRLITPGLIDCHTHLVHGGNRANEWAMRLAGARYEEIARAGGGIVSTMRATREASEAELVASALPRLDALIAEAARDGGKVTNMRLETVAMTEKGRARLSQLNGQHTRPELAQRSGTPAEQVDELLSSFARSALLIA